MRSLSARAARSSWQQGKRPRHCCGAVQAVRHPQQFLLAFQTESGILPALCDAYILGRYQQKRALGPLRNDFGVHVHGATPGRGGSYGRTASRSARMLGHGGAGARCRIQRRLLIPPHVGRMRGKASSSLGPCLSEGTPAHRSRGLQAGRALRSGSTKLEATTVPLLFCAAAGPSSRRWPRQPGALGFQPGP